MRATMKRLMIVTLSCGMLLGCQGDPNPNLDPSAQAFPALNGASGLRRAQLLHYLREANETLDSKTSSEMSDHFSYRDAKGNRIRYGEAPATSEVWALSDLELDKIPGTSTERAFREFPMRTPEKPIIVAVIDGGVDIHHEDLAGVIWTNEAEERGTPGRDNDGNGYVGDVHGWNFLGAADGRNLEANSLEVTREVARMRRLAESRELSESERAYLEKLEASFEAQSGMARRTLDKLRVQLKELDSALVVLRQAGLGSESIPALDAIPAGDELLEQARALARRYLERGVTTAVLNQKISWLQKEVEPHFDLNFNASDLIGDDPARMDDIGYGNSNVHVDADHGTHVAGIIAAIRENGIGINGQSAFVRIMPLRVVPNGDERDKDVGNAIRYAVDNGARVVNMSFGKSYSPNREYVYDAIRYARQKGVLLVHAAGNSGVDIDLEDSFPRRPEGEPVDNWIEVAASTKYFDASLVASFSNYGQKSVDLFAPGMGILSSTPGNAYQSYDGTSMASPEVAGVAALLLSQYPRLTPRQVRAILMRTVRGNVPELVEAPGTGILTDFAKLSVSGGIVNAYEALKTAALLFSSK